MNFLRLHISKLSEIKFVKDLILLSIIITVWFLIWSSIGVEAKSILYFGNNIVENINFIRINFPLFLSFLSSLFLIFIFFLKKKKLNINFLLLFYIYFLFQLIGLFFNSDVNFSIRNNFLVILGSGTLNLFLFLKFFKYENYSKILLTLSIFFCFCFVAFIFISNFNKMLESLAFSTFYSLSLPHDKLLENAYPRTTGLSRMFAVVNLFFVCFYLNFDFKKNKIFKYLIVIFIILIGSIIWGFQSRGTIISYISSILVIILFFENINRSKILNFFLILIIPILIFNGSSSVAKKIYLKNIDENIVNLKDSDLEDLTEEEKSKILKDKKKIKLIKETQIYSSRFLNEEIKTSGRTAIWRYALSNYDKEKLFGYGIQGDRFILGKKYANYGNNSSNVFIYFFLTGGYFSLIILFVILLRISFFSLKIYFKKDKEKIKNSFFFRLSFLILLFFCIRGLVENSYGLFSIDFLLVITSLFIIENLYNNSIDYKTFKIFNY